MASAAEAGPLLPRDAVAPALREALATRAVVIARPALARFRLTGGGRVECLQGLVTCDVPAVPPGGRALGALLTAKGRIVTTLWVTRLDDALLVELPDIAAAAVAGVFARSLPPRLCRFEDATGDEASVGLYGPAAADLLRAVADAAPPAEPGHGATARFGDVPVRVTRVAAGGLDGFECAVPAAAAPRLVATLAGRDAVPGTAALLEERRILAGFPRLRAEIDERTLPQEVRLDELGAVSYTKGCYLGQETVARVHFRGHTNRALAGLALEREPAALPLDVVEGEEQSPAGRVTSACWWPARGHWAALALLKAGLAPGSGVRLADGSAAEVRALPWEPPAGAAAP